jgi:threo-3-hydroxy-L-aspartate ammonia-lyase
LPLQVAQTTDMIDITCASVEKAVRILHSVARCILVLTSWQLDVLASTRVFFECENFQRVGAVKFREAYHAIARFMSSQPSPIVCDGS